MVLLPSVTVHNIFQIQFISLDVSSRHSIFVNFSEVIAFVDRNDGNYEELPESVTDNLYKQFTLKKVISQLQNYQNPIVQL